MNEGWTYQGRQSHGWFGHGTGPGTAQSIPAAGQSAAALGQRIHDLGHVLVAGLPASKRYHDAARLDADDHARLDRLLTATVQALPLGGPATARRVFGVQPDAPGIDGFVRAARLLRDGQGNADLRAATDALGRAAQDIGLDRFKPFLRQADDYLDEQGGLPTLVRDTPGTGPPQAEVLIRPPLLLAPGRLPWGPAIAGLAAQALPLAVELIQREDVRDTIKRFGLDAAKPADVTAAYVFLWAEDHGPWLFDTPQSGPVMEAMAERVVRLAQANPALFGPALAGDRAAQEAVSAAVQAPAPGSGIETRNADEQALVMQMTGEGKSNAEIQTALDERRRQGGRVNAEVRRNTSGIAVASTPLPQINAPWLSVHLTDDQGAPIPGQIAEKLVGQHFSDFGKMREAFWKAVAQTPEIAQSFTEQNLRLMQKGSAPYPPRSEQVIVRSTGQLSKRTYELHHDPFIGQGGDVYNLSTIRVVTPKQHDRLGQIGDEK